MLGHELRLLRTKLGLTLEILAGAVGCSRSWLCELEKRKHGQAQVPEQTVDRLLEALLDLGYARDDAVTSALRQLNDWRVRRAEEKRTTTAGDCR